MSELVDLRRKNINHQRLAMLARGDRRILEELLNGISPEAKKTQIRENSFKALMCLSEQHPAVLLSHWDYFISLLKSDNSFSKYAAIYIITALISADKKDRFEKAFNVYCGRLDDESVMVASHVAGTSGKIAKAKPQLQAKITKRLLDIDKTHFDTGRKDLIKSYIIAAFAEYFEASTDQAKILAFVRKQVDSSSPKTRKMAKEFLKRWEEA
jgi:hypothetical protein